MRISICVCTYNRAHILRYCLESLMNLKVPAGCEAEILVLDNNSRDSTKDVVSYYRQHSPIEILYFHESQQGVSAARNRAAKEARGDYIGFLDDECAPRPNWLEILAADIDEFAPFIIGGPYVGALLPGRFPKWFKIEYGDAYFLADNFERGYQKDFRASGGNMVLHRRVYETQEFDEELGPKGDKMKFGEEISLQEHFMSENVDVTVFYEPRMAVAHYILPHKMSLSYHARRQMELGACHRRFTSAALCYELARVLAHLCVCPFRAVLRDRSAFPYWENYVYERVIPRVMPSIGAALEKVRGRYQ
jgi:glycosyltransferase involved in cell wall biosynthesis